MIIIVVFFKQKTAYELRISDCSSDVCSSVLVQLAGDAVADGRAGGLEVFVHPGGFGHRDGSENAGVCGAVILADRPTSRMCACPGHRPHGRPPRSEERRVGKEGVVRVESGGHSNNRKKNKKQRKKQLK